MLKMLASENSPRLTHFCCLGKLLQNFQVKGIKQTHREKKIQGKNW